MSIVSKIKKNVMSPNELHYLRYQNKPIVPKTILLESTHGRELSGHIYALAKNIKESFPEYKIYIAVKKNIIIDEDFKEDIVEHMSKEYLRLLATCEYLMNDTSFWSFFHKRKEQQYFIFWHGTPLKYLGKSTQVQGYGNVQRNLAAADKIFVNNEFTKEKIIADFGIKNITHNQIIVAPSPRNSALFQEKVIKGRYLYMPTWRGKEVSKVSVSNQLLMELQKLDELLVEGEEMYVKLHPYEASLLNFSEQHYQHLKLYPEKEELYHFLQTVDKLVTDYSSIMFDFALTNRSTILFTFDEAEYINERGMYLELDQLPFEKVRTAQELIVTLRQAKEQNYDKLNEEFNYLDCVDGTAIILNYLFNGKESVVISSYSNWNGKGNVLIYAYQLQDNGITSSLFNLLENADVTKRNYILIWQEGMIPKNLEYKIKQLPAGVYTFIQTGKVQSTLTETLHTFLYMQEWPANKEKVANMYQRDFDRCFPNIYPKHFIHYPGYDRSYAVWTWALQPLGIATNIFVHTDMEKEFQINPKLKQKIIFEAYRQANHVVCVSNSIAKKVLRLVPDAKTVVMEVIINEQRIREIAAQPLDETIPQSLMKDFDDEQTTVFLSVGRFSKQKGYDRLITAFEQLNNASTRLVLICSYGPEREAIVQQINNSPLKDSIYLFENIVKPYYLVKQADAFVFSSRYEGLGMVVFESLAVDTPVIMTEIPETLEVLGDSTKAIVVDNSTEGLLNGLETFMSTGFQTEFFDFETHKNQSLIKWESLF